MRLKMKILRAECQDYDCKLDLDHNLTFKTSIFLFMPLSFTLFIFDRCIMLCVCVCVCILNLGPFVKLIYSLPMAVEEISSNYPLSNSFHFPMTVFFHFFQVGSRRIQPF
jgi:hypothetical protein